MAIWQFSCMVIPRGRELNEYTKEQLISWEGINLSGSTSEFLDNILPIAKSWSKDIDQYGKNDCTCIEIVYDDNQIEEINCRLDLRDLSKDLLIRIIEYIKEINGEILYSGNIYPADITTIVDLMKKSDAAKFCNNPRLYFEEVE